MSEATFPSGSLVHHPGCPFRVDPDNDCACPQSEHVLTVSVFENGDVVIQNRRVRL